MPLARSQTKWLSILTFVGLGLSLASVSFWGREARAQFIVGPVAGAMGEAGRAAADPGEASLLNPASIAHLQQYYVSGHYGMGWHPSAGNVSQYGAVIADGSEGALIPGAFSYFRRKTTLPSGLDFTEQDLQVALADFVFPKLSVGIAAHRLTYEPSIGENQEQTNGHFGLLYTPSNVLGLSFNAYDVFPASDAVPIGVRVVPTLALGSHFIFQETLRLRLDLVRPDKFNEGHRTNVSAGLETFFRPEFAFRLGGFWRETADQTFVTTGIGFRGPRLSFDYAYQRDVRQSEGSRHLFDLWLPF